MKKKMFAKAVLLWTGCLVFGAILCVGIAMLCQELGRYKDGEDVYRHIAQYATEPVIIEERATSVQSEVEPSDWPRVDFDLLRRDNPEVVAWIYAPDTPLNYPIVQGSDNTYYLNHLFDGSVNKLGCLFVDAENARLFEDSNTVIYGHNMRATRS